MALLDLKQYRYNDYLNKVESTVKSIDAVPNRDRMYNCINCEPQRNINVGDTIAIGDIPRNSLVTDVRVLYLEAFPAGTVWDYGFLGDYPDDHFTEIATDIVADQGNVSQWIPVGHTGVRDPSGIMVPAEEDDYRGSLWNGDKRPSMLAMRMNNPTGSIGDAIKIGKMKILISFIRFGEEDIHRGERIPAIMNYTD